MFRGFTVFLLIAISNSVSCLDSRKGFFIDDTDEFQLGSSQTIPLKAIDVPSELSCSQKCFANELCSYKSYDSTSRKCQLYQEMSSDDVKQQNKVTKKVTVKDACDSKDCGSRCKCKSLLGTEEYACDCTEIVGMEKYNNINNNYPGKVLDIYGAFIFLHVIAISNSVSFVESRKGFFIDDTDEFQLGSSKSIPLETIDVPSELACSQKCFASELCSYKSYDSKYGKCQLYQEISSDDVTQKNKVSKKINVKDVCGSKDCGSRCKCKSLLGTEEYACDCRTEGLPKTSSNYVHGSCSLALASNDDVSASYFIQPSLKFGAVSLKCERGIDGKGYAVFHHNTEVEVRVTGYNDACGGYQKQFVYKDNMDTMTLVINNSIDCQQHTKAVCKGVAFVGADCTWLKGRDNKKLLYWGGGPQNGTGCSCGVTGTCADPVGKCNCDINNNYGTDWYTDEGFVTKKEDLPLTGIAIGDAGSTDVEVVKYTIGPLRCVV